MNKNTKLSLVASTLLSLSVFAACVPVALEVPPPVNATPTSSTTVPSDTPSTGTPSTGTPSTGTPSTGTPTTNPTSNPTTNPTTAATVSATPTATPTASPTATSTTYTNDNPSGGGGGGGGGGVTSPSPSVNIVSTDPDGTNTGTSAGIMADTLTISGANLTGTTPSFVFYAGPNYQPNPIQFFAKTASYTTNTGTAATLTVPILTDAEVNQALGRAATTAVTDADRQSLRANIVVSNSGGTAQSGPVGSGGF